MKTETKVEYINTLTGEVVYNELDARALWADFLLNYAEPEEKNMTFEEMFTVEENTSTKLEQFIDYDIKVTVYGETTYHWEKERKKLVKFYSQGMVECEGSERDRYTSVVLGLSKGYTDVDDEWGWAA